MRSATGSAKRVISANYALLTWGNPVSEGGLEPPCPFRGTSTSS
jgi:hypothetical protein